MDCVIARDGSVDSGLDEDISTQNTQPETLIAKEIAYDLISRATGISFSGFSRNGAKSNEDIIKTMRRVTDELIHKHPVLFEGMVKRLENRNEYVPLFSAVGENLFKDGIINWGRIVALYAFAVQWAKHLDSKKGTKAEIENVAKFVSGYVNHQCGNSCKTIYKQTSHEQEQRVNFTLAKWIASQGGWDDVVKHFPPHFQLELPLLRGLLVTGLGLGVLAGMLAIR